MSEQNEPETPRAQEAPRIEEKPKKLGLSARCFIAMGLGVLLGILIGPYASVFDLPSAIFLQLLKMTVLPYLVVSLVIGLGSLTPALIKRVGKISLLTMVSIWLVSIAVIYSLGVTFPHDGSARFHTSSQSVTTEDGSDMVSLFIPENPFAALAEGTVPAIVLFLLLISMALLEHPSKQTVLDILDPIQHTLVWVTNQVNKLLPFGVFCLTTQVAGTMTVSELAKLGLYVALYTIGTFLLSFWLLPMAVSLTTPYDFRTLLRDCWGPVALALGTGSTFVALPSVMEAMRGLISETEGTEGQSEVDAVIPVAYNFPHAGTMFNFLFLLFTASAYGMVLSPLTNLKVIGTGIPALFSGGVFAMSFLLDQAGLPADALGLYMNVQSITLRLKAMLAVVSLMTMALWIHAGLRGQFRFRAGALGALIGGTCGLLVVGGLIVRPYLTHEGKAEAEVGSWTLETSNVVFADEVPATAPEDDALTRLRAGGEIVAGYYPDKIPFSYSNTQHQIVGYSIAMADKFATDMGVRVKLVPVKFGELVQLLEEGRIDTVFGPVPVSGSLLRTVDFSIIYDEELPFLVVRDTQREDIVEKISQGKLDELTIAVLKGTVRDNSKLVAGAELIEIGERDEFEGSKADALLVDEISALAIQLQEPQLHAIPLGTKPVVQLALPVSPGSSFRVVLDAWLTLRMNDGFFDGLQKTWIDGEVQKPSGQRTPLISF